MINAIPSRLVISFLVLQIVCSGAAKNSYGQSVKFRHITSNDKASFGNVWAITEDFEGFIWFGTEDGLYKYDGYDIVPFQHSKVDPGSISGNFVVCLYEDKQRNLWIGTYGDGLNLYDREKNTFHHFKYDPKNEHSLPNDRVKTITESKDGTIWIGTEGGGVATFKVDTTEVTNIQFDVIKQDSLAGNSLFIRAIVEDGKNDRVYVGSFDKGLYIFNKQRKLLKHLRADKKNTEALSSDNIIELFLDSRNRLWIGTTDNGMDLYLPEEQKFIHYPPIVDEHSVCDKEVETIVEDSDGIIWAGTDNGLSMLIDSKTAVPENRFKNFKHDALDDYSVLSNSVKAMYVDSQRSLWAGTYFGGINIYNKHLFKFHPFRSKPGKPNSLSDNNITSFAEDGKGNLWIGTDAGGLDFLPDASKDIYRESYKPIKIKNPKTGELETKVKSVAVDQTGFVWIGLWGDGVYRLNPADNTTAYFGLDDPSAIFHGTSVMQIKVDEKNNIWIGTFGDGVFYYDQHKKSFKHYQTNPTKENALTSERIRSMLIDSKQRVWIGGDVGSLNLFNEKTDSFEKIEYTDVLTKNSNIISLMESHDGKLWIGTVSSGAIVYDPESKKAWPEANDSTLADRVINAMLEDPKGRIWMSTSKGLRVYDPHDKSSVIYTGNDGLQGNHFNSSSALKYSDGRLLFGGINGWNAFYPDSIQTNDQQPRIVFTNFWLNNVPMNVNTAGTPLKFPINSNHALGLEHHQNSFTVEFAALEYNFSSRIRYAYLLEGFNDSWQYINNDRKAIFTNLFPGHYRLIVKATDEDGKWSPPVRSLSIDIYPAWWQTSWFKMVSIFLLLLLFYAIFRLRMAFLLTQRKTLLHEVELRTAELKEKNYDLVELNSEVQSQNEELVAQNEQINTQREDLEVTHKKLEETNEHLEELVNHRTERLEATIKKLDKTVAELDRFVYSASHDLSAPLKSILGLVNIAKIETDPQVISQYYNYIEVSILKLERVIKNLVEFSRNSHLEIRLRKFNFHDLVMEVTHELAFWPEAQKITISQDTDPTLQILSDGQRIKVVLHNLISNGIKYADLTKPDPFIKIHCRQQGENWVIHLQDNGIGIDEKYQDKVFEMYYRATERSQGSGLGLFIVKEIIHKLGGAISIQSSKGKGTDFHIELPLLN